MKTILLLIIILLLVGGGYYFFQNQQKLTPQTTPTPTAATQMTTTPSVPGGTTAFCTPTQLQAVVDPEVAAGNVYGQITIKNTSTTTCQIVGNNTLEIGYPLSVKNFQTLTKGQATTPVFTLEPGQTVYSLLHYANGPQCSSTATQVNAMVSYDISPAESVTFTPTMGSTLSVPSCGKDSEITTIDLYPFSSQQVNP